MEDLGLMCQTALSTFIIKTPNEVKGREYLLDELLLIPPVEFHSVRESMTRSIKAVLDARGGTTPH